MTDLPPTQEQVERAMMRRFMEQAEKIWVCHYAEFNDPECYFGHPNAAPHKTRQPRKHTECGWYLMLPLPDWSTTA